MVTSYSLFSGWLFVMDYHVWLSTVQSDINSSKLGYLKKNMTSDVPAVVKGLTTLAINISVKGQEAVEELMLPVPTQPSQLSPEGCLTACSVSCRRAKDFDFGKQTHWNYFCSD